MGILQNIPLWSAIFGILFAQLIKVPIYFITAKKWDFTLITSTGGMPSSHSSAVTAVATAIGLEQGFESPLFAIAAIFGVIVMYDASGVRRQAGKHATVLNQLVDDFNKLLEEAKTWPKKNENKDTKALKELLGHEPIEVIFGAINGIILAVIIHLLVF